LTLEGVLHYLRYVLAAFMFVAGFWLVQVSDEVELPLIGRAISSVLLGTALWLVFGW
jgi:hypothetical protein